MKDQTVASLSHVAIRTRSIPDSVRYYTEVLGLREAFRMYREDGSLGTVYVFIAPGQYLELFSDGVRERDNGPGLIGLMHVSKSHAVLVTDNENRLLGIVDSFRTVIE